MGMPIEDAAVERVVNNAELNIQNAKDEAMKVLMAQLPERDRNNVWPQDMELVSYNSVRNSYIAMFSNWNFPDKFVTVQYHNTIYYVHVSKNLLRDAVLTQQTLPGLY